MRRRRWLVAMGAGWSVAACTGLYQWHPILCVVAGVLVMLIVDAAYELYDRVTSDDGQHNPDERQRAPWHRS